jgi:hypothetical protein
VRFLPCECFLAVNLPVILQVGHIASRQSSDGAGTPKGQRICTTGTASGNASYWLRLACWKEPERSLNTATDYNRSSQQSASSGMFNFAQTGHNLCLIVALGRRPKRPWRFNDAGAETKSR